MDKYCFLDFEYRGTSEKNLDLVSCALTYSPNYQGYNYWLFNDKAEQSNLRQQQLLELRNQGYIFIAYAVTAEARSMLSMAVDVLKIEFIDLYLEYRCLCNHNHNFMYGKQLLNGIRKETKPPKNKWQMSEEQKKRANNSKPEHNLASACYKVLGEVVDTDEKNEVRDIIIHGTPAEVEDAKDRILRYNESDIQYLPRLFKGIINEYKRLLEKHPEKLKTLKEEMLLRGNYAARTAIMESLGYPIDFNATRAFSESVSSILWDTQSEINGLFSGICPFRKGADRSFSWRQKETRAWILEQGFKNWVKTDTGQPSLSLDAWKKFFPFSHNYPKDNFGAQMVRFLTLRQQLNGFLQSKTAKKKNNFWDSVGTDGRVRPYFGIYGSQSARSQPKATGFLFLKSAWMRSLCVPREGRAICGIDYKSQEFLLAALLSGDANMLEAYQSGDPYLHLAKLAGAVPKDGLRKDYKVERDTFKTTTLGISYNMTKVGLAVNLTQALGKTVTEAQAQKLINKFDRAYSVYTKWKKGVVRQYRKDGHVKLPCGWMMFSDNDNDRSVTNCPVQGFGSSVMRKAVALAQDAGLDVIKTLHDALYIEYDSFDYEAITTLARCMDEAFRFYFPISTKPLAFVGLDANTWSLDYPDETKYISRNYTVTKEISGEMEKLQDLEIKQQQVYIDERGEKEYGHFKQYFKPEEFNL